MAQRSTSWKPYVADGNTFGLYHLDAANPDTSVAAQTDLEKEDVEIFNEPAANKTDPPFAVNAFAMGETAELVGEGAFVRDGRFLGGIRLQGKDGRLVVPNRTGRGWTLEYSFRAATLPPERAVLVDLPEGDPFRVSLLHDGHLAVEWKGGKNAKSTWKCAPSFCTGGVARTGFAMTKMCGSVKYHASWERCFAATTLQRCARRKDCAAAS